MILQELSEAVGVWGKEDAVRQIILKAIEGHMPKPAALHHPH